MSRSGLPANRNTSANAPSSLPSTRLVASTGSSPSESRWSMSRAAASLSVWLSNSWPMAASSALISWKFSMMPLWIIATRAVAWGWALDSVAAPWVAHRVWPMPTRPEIGSSSSRRSSAESLPEARRRSMAPAESSTASPAES